MLNGFGAPIPEIFAIYHPFRLYQNAKSCRNVDDLTDFLRSDAPYPFFAKPVYGVQSVGVSSVTSYHADTDTLMLAGGRSVPLDDYVNHLHRYQEGGYIIQQLLVPHDAIKEVIGDRLTTIRVLLIVEEAGPSILQTVWKITTGDNVADNFWREGNMLAAVDADSGEVTRVVQGIGPQQTECSDHPDTGKRLIGLVLPDWDEMRDLCLTCAAQLPRLRWQSWDVALCPNGPVAVEINAGSAFSLPQIATGEGFLTDRFAAFMNWASRERRQETQEFRNQLKRDALAADI